MNKEKIMHAAVMSDTGWIFIGKHHADCIHKMTNMGLNPYHDSRGQGFVTSRGRFVFRSRAAKIAIEAEQVDKVTELLFSEDMWSDEYRAKHYYDEVKGYCLREGEVETQTS